MRTYLLVTILSLALSIGPTAYSQALTPDPNTPRPIEALDTLWIEDMTWMEVRDAMAEGKTTVIIPTGGIEQNGPYLAAGSHQVILKAIVEKIARKLGNTLIASIVQYVPEGDIDPPTGHMLYPSTLSVSGKTFEALLTDIANSLRTHGFEHIVLIGDSGGNQRSMNAVAKRLSKKWKRKTNKFGKKPHIYYIPEFYNNKRWNDWIKDQGYDEVDEGIHDDLRHTAILMTVDPEYLRFDQRVEASLTTINGVSILPKDKIIQLGNDLIDYHAEVTVDAIQVEINRRK